GYSSPFSSPDSTLFLPSFSSLSFPSSESQLWRDSWGRRRKIVPWKDSSSNLARPEPRVVMKRLDLIFFNVTGKLESTLPLNVDTETVALDCSGMATSMQPLCVAKR